MNHFEKPPQNPLQTIHENAIDTSQEKHITQITAQVKAQLTNTQPPQPIELDPSIYNLPLSYLTQRLKENASIVNDPNFNDHLILSFQFSNNKKEKEDFQEQLKEVFYGAIHLFLNDLYHQNKSTFNGLSDLQLDPRLQDFPEKEKFRLIFEEFKTAFGTWFTNSMKLYEDQHGYLELLLNLLQATIIVHPSSPETIEDTIIRGINTAVNSIWSLFEVITILLDKSQEFELNQTNFLEITSSKSVVIFLMKLADFDIFSFANINTVLHIGSNANKIEFAPENFELITDASGLSIQLNKQATELALEVLGLASWHLPEEIQAVRTNNTKNKVGCPGKKIILPLLKAAQAVALNNLSFNTYK